MEPVIRSFCPDDLEAIKAITIEGFEGVSVEHGIELKFGEIAGHDWRWRKARHVDEDVKEQAAGIFVAEVDGEILGYISTRLDPEAGKGRIPNLAVAASAAAAPVSGPRVVALARPGGEPGTEVRGRSMFWWQKENG